MEEMKHAKQQHKTIGIRADAEFVRIWNALPADLNKSEVIVKLVKHALRCGKAREEFAYDFSLGAQAVLWPSIPPFPLAPPKGEGVRIGD
jgi:hypothetical protein